MYKLKKKLENYLRVNLLGPGHRLKKKKNLPGRGLTKVEKHWSKVCSSVLMLTFFPLRLI